MMTLGVSIICSTNRPQFLKNILKNYQRQRYLKKELIIIINKNNIRLEEYQKIIQNYKNVSIYKKPENDSLGHCLNFGIAKSKFPLVTKMDDDDFYSPYYLSEQVKVLINTGAQVVGKRSYFVYLTSKKRLLLRFPGSDHKFVEHVQGGTILFRKKLKVRFANRSLGEDVAFMRDCRKKGYKAFATSRYNYVYVRRKDRNSHTWPVSDSNISRGTKLIAVTTKYRSIATKRV